MGTKILAKLLMSRTKGGDILTLLLDLLKEWLPAIQILTPYISFAKDIIIASYYTYLFFKK